MNDVAHAATRAFLKAFESRLVGDLRRSERERGQSIAEQIALTRADARTNEQKKH